MQDHGEHPSYLKRIADMRMELERAYRALHGFYHAHKQGKLLDKTTLAYHSPTIGAVQPGGTACRRASRAASGSSKNGSGKGGRGLLRGPCSARAHRVMTQPPRGPHCSHA